MSHNRFFSLNSVLCLSILLSGCGDGTSPDTGPINNEVAATNSSQNDENSQTDVRHDSEPVSDQPSHHYFHKEEKPHAAEWGYEGQSGPKHWGDLSPDYVLAKTGQQQSPIDISKSQPMPLPEINFSYGPSQIDLVYNGHTVEEVEDHQSTIEFDGKTFVLQQFHFHSPSEHTVDGQHFDMEMHLVHKSDDGEIAVVGVLISEGADNAAFDQIWNYLPSAANRERKEKMTVDAATLLPSDHGYYRYTGSFTTPPCTEDVLWMVLKSPVELSAGQIRTFRAIIEGNNRPVQPLNDRTVAVSTD